MRAFRNERDPTGGVRRRVPCAVFVALLACLSGSARAQAIADTRDVVMPDALAPDVIEPAGPADAAILAQPPESPEARAARAVARQIRALVDGTLDTGVDPSTLFDVPLDADGPIGIEARRLRTLTGNAACPAPAPAPPVLLGPPKPGGEVVADEAPPPAPPPAVEEPDAWVARLDLDQARLAFYELPAARRAEILAVHEARRADAAKIASHDLDDAEREAREAAERERLAQEAARNARTEAERLVADENARLLAVASQQAAYKAEIERTRQALKDRTESILALRRRIREGIEGTAAAPASLDGLYDEVRSVLRASRSELAAVLASSGPDVPVPGPDRLAGLSLDIKRDELDALRRRLDADAAELAVEAADLSWTRATQVFGDVQALNADRLALLSRLSRSKWSEITGIGEAGFDQASAELLQLTLVTRYHFRAVFRWISPPGEQARVRASAVAPFAKTGFIWLLALFAFVGWRRRAVAVLTAWRERIREDARRARATRPPRMDGVIGFLLHVHRPLELLAFLGLLVWTLPVEAASLLEVRIATTVFTWVLGGALAVLCIDAVAGGSTTGRVLPEDTSTAGLRLRSLRLLGRVVAVFGLVLSVVAELVGRGTIFNWVFYIFWPATLVVVLWIVRWWRHVIFDRFESRRKKTAYEQWVVAHRVGWKSFVAGVSGGAFLFAKGAARAVRAWIGRFDATRRILAYLFRRDLEKRGQTDGHPVTGALPEDLLDALGPDTRSRTLVEGTTREGVTQILRRIDQVGGGVFAVVGPRGAGKSTVLDQVCLARPDVVHVDCPFEGFDALSREIVRAVGLSADTSLEEVAATLDEPGGDRGLVIDNAHRLILPVMGGMAEFDRLLAVARVRSTTCTWILALNEITWQFFEQARGTRPLFDDVVELGGWREAEIGTLVLQRSREAGCDPSFAGLMDDLPADADDEDRAEAVAKVTENYHRLLWDYSAGNPGVALHAWRRSLGLDADGRVLVGQFQAPDSRELELLPDPAVFVLRAVLQIENARPAIIARATMLGTEQVMDTLRYGCARGFFDRAGDTYRVNWTWFRPIALFLKRRHLLRSDA